MNQLEKNQHIIEEYRKSGQPWPAPTRLIAQWAIKEKLWMVNPATALRRCQDELTEAMRQEYFTDPQGRRVRAKHVAHYEYQGGKMIPLWDDMRTATHEHMEISFANRRQQIVQDCHHLKRDVDSYNENYNKSSKAIQLPLDFTYDVEELEIGIGVAA